MKKIFTVLACLSLLCFIGCQPVTDEAGGGGGNPSIPDNPEADVRSAVSGLVIESSVFGDFRLPVYFNDVDISWKSSDAAITIDEDDVEDDAVLAKVTLPDARKPVTLTATFEKDGKKGTKDYPVTVLSKADADAAKKVYAALQVENPVLEEKDDAKLKLVNEIDVDGKKYPVVWSDASGFIEPTGTAGKRDFVDKTVKLTATVKNPTSSIRAIGGEDLVSKDFNVTVNRFTEYENKNSKIKYAIESDDGGYSGVIIYETDDGYSIIGDIKIKGTKTEYVVDPVKQYISTTMIEVKYGNDWLSLDGFIDKLTEEYEKEVEKMTDEEFAVVKAGIIVQYALYPKIFEYYGFSEEDVKELTKETLVDFRAEEYKDTDLSSGSVIRKYTTNAKWFNYGSTVYDPEKAWYEHGTSWYDNEKKVSLSRSSMSIGTNGFPIYDVSADGFKDGEKGEEWTVSEPKEATVGETKVMQIEVSKASDKYKLTFRGDLY